MAQDWNWLNCCGNSMRDSACWFLSLLT